MPSRDLFGRLNDAPPMTAIRPRLLHLHLHLSLSLLCRTFHCRNANGAICNHTRVHSYSSEVIEFRALTPA